ncbi:hypothetical protein EC836_101949 [Erwinia sp. JUb26]|nr:hypothetical protein EC836_101949 [Erwinia sp. JUb26]
MARRRQQGRWRQVKLVHGCTSFTGPSGQMPKPKEPQSGARTTRQWRRLAHRRELPSYHRPDAETEGIAERREDHPAVAQTGPKARTSQP